MGPPPRAATPAQGAQKDLPALCEWMRRARDELHLPLQRGRRFSAALAPQLQPTGSPRRSAGAPHGEFIPLRREKSPAWAGAAA